MQGRAQTRESGRSPPRQLPAGPVPASLFRGEPVPVTGSTASERGLATTMLPVTSACALPPARPAPAELSGDPCGAVMGAAAVGAPTSGVDLPAPVRPVGAYRPPPPPSRPLRQSGPVWSLAWRRSAGRQRHSDHSGHGGQDEGGKTGGISNKFVESQPYSARFSEW